MRGIPETEDTRARPTGTRIQYIDGLRGVAIAMVLVEHGWFHHFPLHYQAFQTQHTFVAYLLSRGWQGVSLFLVLSGFCLSYPALKRRQVGDRNWFRPSEFFARRCVRILPTYYVALALFALIAVILSHEHIHSLTSIGPSPDASNLLSHVFLIHNMTSCESSINASFWSLALEWQWYWVFSILLFFAAVASPFILVGCLGIGAAWMHVLGGTMIGSGIKVTCRRKGYDTMKRMLITLTIAVALVGGVVTPSFAGRASASHAAALDKAKFALHLGVALFAAHHVYSRYKAGAFSKGAPHRARSVVANGALLIIGYREAKAAYRLAKNSNSKTLQAVIAPLNALTNSMGTVGSKFKRGSYSASDVTMLNGQSAAASGASSAAGYRVTDRPVALPAGA